MVVITVATALPAATVAAVCVSLINSDSSNYEGLFPKCYFGIAYS